ncbi:hypothetical protein BDN67DRAFT_1015528 [Paxillus ammoniavirescens]|nr:hypothetical protein BDN67DRAFT_1015528 [Paxillus ammoniavirescens]
MTCGVMRRDGNNTEDTPTLKGFTFDATETPENNQQGTYNDTLLTITDESNSLWYVHLPSSLAVSNTTLPDFTVVVDTGFSDVWVSSGRTIKFVNNARTSPTGLTQHTATSPTPSFHRRIPGPAPTLCPRWDPPFAHVAGTSEYTVTPSSSSRWTLAMSSMSVKGSDHTLKLDVEGTNKGQVITHRQWDEFGAYSE